MKWITKHIGHRTHIIGDMTLHLSLVFKVIFDVCRPYDWKMDVKITKNGMQSDRRTFIETIFFCPINICQDLRASTRDWRIKQVSILFEMLEPLDIGLN